MTRVLWVSRHHILPATLRDIKRLYPDAEVIGIEVALDAEDIDRYARELGAAAVFAVLPAKDLARLMDLAKGKYDVYYIMMDRLGEYPRAYDALKETLKDPERIYVVRRAHGSGYSVYKYIGIGKMKGIQFTVEPV